MPDGFQVMGGQPQGYGSIINGAAGGLVRMPDGSLAPFPQMSGPTSLNDIYGFTGFAPSAPSPSSPIGPGADWGALTGMLDDPIYSGQPYTPQNTTYGQPPTSVAQTRAEQRQQPTQALAAIASAVPSIPYASGTINGNKDQSRLDTPLLAFNGDQANGLVPGGAIGGSTGAGGKVSLASLLGGVGIGGRVLPDTYLSGDPGQTDWSVANNGMQGINGPLNAKYLPNDPRSQNPNAKVKALPKYAVNTAPGTFNRETGTFNTGMPASGGGLPNILGGLGGGGLSMLGKLFGGGNAPDTRQTLLGHILSGILGGGQQQGAQALAGMVPGIGDALAQHPLNIPQSGQLIATNNNGNQVIGDHLNGSPRGMTVTNDNWFNAVRGL